MKTFLLAAAMACFIVGGTGLVITLMAFLSAPCHAQVLPLPQADKDISMMEIRKPELTPRLQETLDRLLFRDMLTQLRNEVFQNQTILHQPCGSEK